MIRRNQNETNPNDANGDASLRDLMTAVRKSAYNGASAVIPKSEHAILQDIVSWTLVEIIRRRGSSAAKRIEDPPKYAYAIARREAIHWMKGRRLEKRSPGTIPFAEAVDSTINDELIAEGTVEPANVLRHELVESLPELFERFQTKVISQLCEEDHAFFQHYFLERVAPDQLAKTMGIQPKSVAQRWRRLLVALHKGLLEELRCWAVGKELYLDIMRDRDRIAEFVCLLRLFIEEGIEAVKALIDSIGRC